MEIRALGPLLVDDGGVVVPIRGPIALRLLAILVIGAGHGVSMARLIRGIWDEAPPDTAHRQVRHAASRLHRELGAERIDYAGDGYLLRVEDREVDARRFETATRRARDRREHGDHPEALGLLRSGLALWRGEPFSGLDSRIIRAEAARLAELRLASVEERIELELDGGASGDAIGELRQLLSEHPFRQRLAGLLMSALHRNGRTPEALAVYAELRTKLAEDLGLDPSAALRRHHAAILRGTTGPHPAASPTVVTPPNHVPAQLPAGLGSFTGRDRELRLLQERLYAPEAPRSGAIVGPAGSGKTALAVHWAHQVRDRFPDGQLFVNLRGFDASEPVSASAALGRFIRALQGPHLPIPSDVDEAAALYRSLVAERRLLVVLDNARTARQVRPLLPPGDSCFALITSRHRLSGLTALDGVGSIPIGVLERAESTALLTGVIGPERVAAEPSAVARLAGLCGDLPLALRVAAAYLAAHPNRSIAGYGEELGHGGRLAALTIDGDPDAAVVTALDHSHRVLAPEARRLFCLLGSIPGEDLSHGLAVAVHDVNREATDRELERLQAGHLIEQHLPHRYRMHDLVREYAAERAAAELTAADRQAVADRFIAWHHGFQQESRPDEEANILAGCQAFADHPELWRLTATMLQAINAGRRHEGLREALEQSLANAVGHGDALGEFRVTNLFTAFHWSNDDGPAAIDSARAAIALAQDTPTLATANASLAVTLYNNRRYAEAEPYQRLSLELAPDSTDWRVLFNRRFNLGNIHYQCGDYGDAAEIYFGLADDVAQRDSPHHAMRLGLALARIHQVTGRLGEAESAATRAIDIAVGISDRRFETIARIERGRLRRGSAGDKAAMSDLLTAFNEARELRHPVLECDALCELVITCSRTGDHARAREYTRSLADHPAARSRPVIQADIALALAVMHTEIGEYRVAIRQAFRAVELNRAATRPLELARSHLALGHAHTGAGDDTAATHAWQEALDRYDRLGTPEGDSVRRRLGRAVTR